MGVYNTYGSNPAVQLKVAEVLTLKTFSLGDPVDLADGLYVGNEGFVIVESGKLSGTSTHLALKDGKLGGWSQATTSWGDVLGDLGKLGDDCEGSMVSARDIAHTYNPVVAAVRREAERVRS